MALWGCLALGLVLGAEARLLDTSELLSTAQPLTVEIDAPPLASPLSGWSKRAGGRWAQEDSKVEDSKVNPAAPTLTLVQITDVYTLENFPSLRTLMRKLKQRNPGNTWGVLTGDFLAPYLLSTVDNGDGMMRMLNAEDTVDFITWGNHEADVPHAEVCRHVRQSSKTWINSNMDHDTNDYQTDSKILTITSADGAQTRKVGLCAVLSNDPKLYAHFPAPGAFGGAHIHDPFATLEAKKAELEAAGCDLVVPLEHMYEPQDHETCRRFNFPVVLSGHDHHRVDEVVEGTRLLKPGQDAMFATVLELSWAPDAPPRSPPTSMRATFVRLADYAADPELLAEVDRAYAVLDPLRNSELLPVPPKFLPLSSVGARGRVCSMGTFVCSMLRNALNTNNHDVDAVLLMGGNIRGSRDYPAVEGKGSPFFSMEGLDSEIKREESVGIVRMPGWLLSEGVRATHRGGPIPGWFQYCDGVEEDEAADAIVRVAGRPIDLDRIYRVATKVPDLVNGQSPPFAEYYTAHPEMLPTQATGYANVHAELMHMAARNLFRRLWETVEELGAIDVESRLEAMGYDASKGELTVETIHRHLSSMLDLSTDDGETSLAQEIHSYADVDGDGRVTLADFLLFRDCNLLPETEGPVTRRLREQRK